MSTSRRHILGMGAALAASLCLPAASWASAPLVTGASARKLLILTAGSATDTSFAAGVSSVAAAQHVQTLDLNSLLSTGLKGCASTLCALQGSRLVGMLEPHRYAMLQEVLREAGAGVWAEGHHQGEHAKVHRFMSLPRSEQAGAQLAALLAHARSPQAWPAATGALMAQIALDQSDVWTREKVAAAMPTLMLASRSTPLIDSPQISFVAEL